MVTFSIFTPNILILRPGKSILRDENWIIDHEFSILRIDFLIIMSEK